jgi:DNA polymerase lambda
MELFHSEGGKLRKKDKIAYYKNDDDELVAVPTMTSTKEEAFFFLKTCALRTVDGVTDEMIEKVWAQAEEKKELILSGLQQMKDEAEASGENTYKVIAYVKAIKKIKSIHVPILSGEQAQKLKDIGPGIGAVINEILRHGRLKTQEERIEGAAARQPVIDLFMGIWDVKAKTASHWYNKGHKEIEDLVDEELTNKQKLGIKYYDDLQKKIAPNTVKNAVQDLKDVLKTEVEGIGPYRAGAQEFDVIEVLVHGKSGKAALKKIVDKLDGKIQSSITLVDVDLSDLKPAKFSGICHLRENYYRIDIHLIPESEIGVFLLFTTGPKEFLNNIKEQAAVLDYRLDKKGLVKVSVEDEEKIETPTEQSIFAAIGMDYVEPANRS